MHKYELLRQRADTFKSALEHYAKVDRDIEWLLEKFMPWYERVQRMEIRLPCYEYQLGRYFLNSDLSWQGSSSIADRYFYETDGRHPLVQASVSFDEAMQDRLSSSGYLNWIEAHGGEPIEILDEPPPPSKEAPLQESREVGKRVSICGLLHRLLNRMKP